MMRSTCIQFVHRGRAVNKVATAIHLRFDIRASSLPDEYKQRLLQCPDQRITIEGVIMIKTQQYRNQQQNRRDALYRLQVLVRTGMDITRKRKPIRKSFGSIKRRLESKSKRGHINTA